MDPTVDENAEDAFAFCSSIADDVRHPGLPYDASEAWYFDALSDDGNEAVTITFLDNIVDSPRGRRNREKAEKNHRPPTPGVGISYFRDGKIRYAALLKFGAESFQASETEPFVKIGSNIISFRSASYGTGYHIQIDGELNSGRRIRANFEWLAIESDLEPKRSRTEAAETRLWNMAAPRCDVTGKVAVSDRRGRDADTFQFRGTGYHDHTLRSCGEGEWHWGRAHFADATAVFYGNHNAGGASTKLMLVRDTELVQRDVIFEQQSTRSNGFGAKYPSRVRLISRDNARLRIKPLRIIDSGPYGTRFLSEMTLTLRDGVPLSTMGISGVSSAARASNRWLRWFADLRTRKDGRSSAS